MIRFLQCLGLVVVLGCGVADVRADWIKASDDAMGTRVSVEFWSDDDQQARVIADVVLGLMHDVDDQLSPYIKTSELYKVNAEAYKKPVKVSDDFFSLLEKSLYYSRLSGGAFDITYASVGYMYNYRKGKEPSAEQIKEKLPAINYRHIQLNKEDHTVRFTYPNVKIDLGGIAKGYAVDRAIDILKSYGVTSAIVTAGGDSRMLGDRRGKPWIIGIRHPRKKHAFAARIPLQDTAISTSGDYERFFMKGKVRVHHIINPKSGRSADKVESVSIIAPLAEDSDALSTTVFVLGLKKGMALVNRLPGVDAIIIDSHTRLYYSDGLLRQKQ